MKNKIMVFILSAACIIGLVIIYINYNNKSIVEQEGIIITEVVTKNDSILSDEDFDFSDYIEIYNNSSSSQNLLGYGLSDNLNLPFKWTFPDITIKPYEYLLVFADNKDIMAIYPHTNFALSSKGEAVILTDPKGTTLSTLVIGECDNNMVYALQNGQYVYCETGSPLEKSNEKIVEDSKQYLTELDSNGLFFNMTAGFYTEDFYLEISSNNTEAVIRYTTDGSTPSMDSTIYTETIHITARENEENKYIPINTTFSGSYNPPADQTKRGTVVKAQVYVNDKPKGDVKTNTYFVDDTGVDMYSLPVVSLSTDPENFWSDEKGIYVVGSEFLEKSKEYDHIDCNTPANYRLEGIEWERECFIEYFENGTVSLEQALGVRIFGDGSRANQKKSLKLFARDTYSNDTIYYPIFDGLKNEREQIIENFSKLIMRSGGNDFEVTFFRDTLMTGLAKDYLDVQASQPIILYINGEYYGIYFLRESLDEDYIESHYGIPKDDVAIIKNFNEGKKDDVADYLQLIEFAQDQDLSIAENYEVIDNRIDLDDFINYYVAEMYFANGDWPANNTRVWRMRTDEIIEDAPEGQDGKYRFMLYDTDNGMGRLFEDNMDENVFDYLLNNQEVMGGINPHWTTDILRGLMNNVKFRYQFINTFCDQLNTTYSTKTVLEKIDDYRTLLAPEVEENMIRYGLWESIGVTQWYDKIGILERFAEQRPADLFEKMAEYYKETLGTLVVENKEGGTTNINDHIKVGKDDVFTGTYLTHVPITLIAIPDDGYEFVNWDNGDTNETLTIMFTEDYLNQTYMPIFEKVEDNKENNE